MNLTTVNAAQDNSQRHSDVTTDATPSVAIDDLIVAPQDHAHSRGNQKIYGIVTAQLAGIGEHREPQVTLFNNLVSARSTIPLTLEDIGQQAIVQFENGDPALPIITGLLHAITITEHADSVAEVDGQRVTITGKEEIVLKCGKASITLTKAGKVLIRGAYLSSRSSGANRIKGGSVQIN